LSPFMSTFRGVRLVAFFVVVTLAVCGFGFVLTACEMRVMWFHYADAGADVDAGDDSDADVDAGPDDSLDPSAESQCDGECVPGVNRLKWSGPLLVWVGDPAEAPAACPANAPHYAELHAGPISSDECHACICGDPACVLPEGLIASDAAGCMGPTFTPFPIASDGSCRMGPPVESSNLQSLALLPPTVSSCEPSLDLKSPPGGQTQWGKTAIVCDGEGYGKCDREHKCAPKAPSGFMQCVFNDTEGDDVTCPDPYTLKITLYEHIDEAVVCTPCTCSSPLGSDCTAVISAYQDTICTSSSALFENYLVSQSGPLCATIVPNMALQSASSKWITNQPGVCMPDGGKPTGKVAVDHATAYTFCCQEEEEHDVPR
jgi:hypothetical protein